MARKAGTTPININVRDDLVERAKEEATRRKWTLTTWLERAIERALPKREGKP